MGAGEACKKQREEMGKTLEEVSSELRISQKYLRGIEGGNFSRFPAKVFSTGFIRAYATFLSLAPEPVLSEYRELFERSSKEEPPIHGKPEWLERERQRGSRRTAYAIAAAAGLVIGIFLARYGKATPPRPPPVPEIRQTAQPPHAPDPASGENPALPSDNAAVRAGEAAEAPPASEPSAGI